MRMLGGWFRHAPKFVSLSPMTGFVRVARARLMKLPRGASCRLKLVGQLWWRFPCVARPPRNLLNNFCRNAPSNLGRMDFLPFIDLANFALSAPLRWRYQHKAVVVNAVKFSPQKKSLFCWRRA